MFQNPCGTDTLRTTTAGPYGPDTAPAMLCSESAIVHLQYEISEPPSVPSPEWTRFVCISDTHTRSFPVPPGDVLLHSGDLTSSGRYSEFKTTLTWLASLPHAKKIIIAGNHDIALDTHGDWYDTHYHRWHRTKEDQEEIRKLFTGPETRNAGIVYLDNERHDFQAKDSGKVWSVYGSPWSPYFGNWAFNYHRGVEADELIKTYQKTDILLTHGPPFQILDKTILGEHVGCEALAARLPALRPRLQVFGHIHEDHGAEIRKWPSTIDPSHVGTSREEQTVLVNAANWPMGPKARGSGARVPFGGGPFQPVIVDLLETV